MNTFIENKKSILCSIGFLFFTLLSKAQEPTTAILLFQQKSWVAAKESVDSFVQLNSTNTQGWLLKAQIYTAISKDINLKDLLADGRNDAFEALQKGVLLNKLYIDAQLKPTNYNLPFDLYNGYTNEAVAYFNAGAERNDKGSFNEALNKFKKAARVSSYIYNNNWGLYATDSNNLYYCAKAAIYADKEEDAFLFAKQIADAGINKTVPHNTGFENIYQWLAYYYKQQKDGQNLVKYSQLGMQLFPASVYFNLVLIDWQRQQKDYVGLLATYQALFKRQPGNNTYQLAYLNDLFNYLYQSKQEINGRALYIDKLSKGILQYIKTNPTAIDARLLLAKTYINQANDLGKEVLLRSTTDATILNGYKAQQAGLLRKSNQYLKEIISKFCKKDIKNCEEAKGLMKGNGLFLLF